MGELKLNLGCGKISKKGFVNIDQNDFPNVDRVLDIRELDYPPNSVDYVRMNYVLEHLTYAEGRALLENIFRMLKPNGQFEFSCPDLDKCCKKFLEAKERKWTYWMYNIYGAQRWPGDVHKSGYTFEFIKPILSSIGFTEITDISPTDEYHAHNFRVLCRKV